MRSRRSQLGGGRSRFSLGGLRPGVGGGGGPVLTAPAQIAGGQWTLTDSPSAGADKLSLNITALPLDGGSAITALEYSIGGGAWTALAGTGTGARLITVLASTLASVQVRAVNAIGNGTASTAKTATPTSSLTAPAAMTIGQWTLSDVPSVGGDTLSINITALPSNGGSAITALEYRIGGGSAVALSGTGTGARSITVPATTLASIEVRAVNAIGPGAWSDTKIATPSVLTVNPITTTPANTYTFAGDASAFTLDANLSLGAYVMGDPVFISDATANFTQTGAPWATISGYGGNGMEENFVVTQSPLGQGLDALLAANTLSGVIGTLPYLSARNKDVTAAAANYAVPVDHEITLVKSGRRSGAGTASWNIIDNYRLLTIVPAAKHPNVGDFRPGIASPDKTSWLNVSDITFAGFPSLNVTPLITGLVDGLPSYATTLANWRNPLTSYAIGGDPLRAMQIMAHMGGSSYSAEIGDLPWATGLHFMNSALSDPQKLDLAMPVCQSAIDQTAEVEEGFVGGIGAGQWEAYWYIIALAYALTGHARFRAALVALNSSARQCAWTDNVGKKSPWPAGQEGPWQQYVGPRHIEYAGQGIWSTDGLAGAGTNEMDRTYLAVSGRARPLEVPVIAAIQAWGSTLSGVDMFTDGGAQSDITVQHGAMIHLVDLEMSTYPYSDANYIKPGGKAAYDLLRPYNPVPKIDTFPPAIPHFFSPTFGASQISWNFSAAVAANFGSVGTPITGQKVEVSQDGIQFEQASLLANDAIAAVPGVVHWARLSLQNANGWGVPSRTWQKYVGFADSGKGTPTGTSSGTVTNTVAPKLMAKKYIENRAPFYVPASGILPVAEPLYLGCGIWTGALTGTPTVIAEVEMTAMSGVWTPGAGILATEDGRHYYIGARNLSEAGKRVRVSSTWMGVTAYSAPLTFDTVPAMTVFPRVENLSAATLVKSNLLNGIADGKQGTVAFKGKLLGDDGQFRNIFNMGLANTSAPVNVQRRSTDKMRVTLKNAAGTTIGTIDSSSNLNVATGEFVFMASWDMAANISQMYRDDTSIKSGSPTMTNSDIDYTPASGATITMGALDNMSLTLDAEIDYVYFDPTFVDLSVLANRDKFKTAAAIGHYGQGPTGSIPSVFHIGDAAARNAGLGNRGYGGYFYLNNSANEFVDA